MKQLKENTLKKSRKINRKKITTNGLKAYEDMILGYIYDNKSYSEKGDSIPVYSESAKQGRFTMMR